LPLFDLPVSLLCLLLLATPDRMAAADRSTVPADIVLASSEALTSLYELRGACEGAQCGSHIVVHKATGQRFCLRTFTDTELRGRKYAELAEAIAAQRRIAEASSQDDGAHLASARLANLHEVLRSPQGHHLVSELAPTGGSVSDDLLSLLQRRGRLSEADARAIFLRLVVATKRAHDARTVLRSLKPETVQVRQREAGAPFEVCITDLSCAARVAHAAGEDDELVASLTGLHGTPEYAAPEVVIWYWRELVPPRLPEPPPAYGAKADVWALGMLLHVMLCGCFPFDSSLPDEELLRAINAADFAYTDPGWARLSAEALELVGRLLRRDPEERPYLEEVLQHAFCAGAMQEAAVAESQITLPSNAFDAALDELDALGDA
jgi:serine/threonine protein kinase